MKLDPNSPKKPSDPVEKALMVLFALLLVPPAVWLFSYLYAFWTMDEVVSTHAIGHFVSMSGPGGLQNSVVIATDLGSFPLRSPGAIAKGTPLILERRASGQRFICDARRVECIGTDGPDFGVFTQGAHP